MVNGGPARRSFDILGMRTFTAIADVVTDTFVEQHRVLRHDPDAGAQRALGDVTDVLIVEQYPPTSDVIKTVEQPRDGRFTRARRPDNGQGSAGRDGKTDAFEYFAVGIVTEMHGIEHKRTSADDQRLCPRLIDDLAFGIEQIEHCRHIGQALPDGAIDHSEHVERTEKLS